MLASETFISHSETGTEKSTPNHYVFDDLFLGALFPASLFLFTQLGKYQRPDALNDLGKYWVPRIEQPRLCQGRIVEVNPTFKDRIFRNSQITT